MPSTSVIPQTNNQPISPPITAKAEKIERITGKVRAAIEAMVWQALPRAAAAKAAGISEHGLYKALRKPPVKAFYLAECEVLRTSGRARRILRLEEIGEQDENKAAAVQAIRALEGMSDDQAVGRSAQSVPGLVIQIINNGPPPRTIDALVTQPQAIEHET